MTTRHHPDSPNAQHVPVGRLAYGALLILAVAALLIFALRYAFPGGQTGIQQDPEETAPADSPPN